MPTAYVRTALPYAGLRLAGQGFEFVGFALLARQLGTTDFGTFSVAFLICRYAGIVGDWGASIGGSRDVAASAPPAAVVALVRRREQVSLSLTAVFVLGTFLVGQPALAPLGAAILARGIARDWMSLGQERAIRSASPAVIQGLLFMLGAMIAEELLGASLATAAAYIAAAVASIILNRLPAGTVGSRASVQGWLLLAVLADQVYASIDILFLAWMRGAAESGVYAAGYRFPNAWLTLLGLFVTAALPRMTRTLLDAPSSAPWVRSRALRLGGASALGPLLLIPIAWVALPLVFGEAYESGRAPVTVLLVATAISSATAFLGPLYVATRSDRHLGLFTSLTAVVNVAGNLLLVPALGMSGAAISTLLSQGLLSLFLLSTTRQARR